MILTHKSTFGDADILLVFLPKKKEADVLHYTGSFLLDPF